MTFSQYSGTFVFIDRYNESVLLAYHKLNPMYLVFIYRRRQTHVFFSRFEDILNTLPIHSMTLPIKLTIKKDLVFTIHAWFHLFLEYLSMQSYRLIA